MRRSSITLAGASAVALLALAACGGPSEAQQETTAAQNQAAAQAQASPAPALSQADTYFLDEAAQQGMLEVQSSQIAETRAPSRAVRSLAQSLVRDHTWVNDSLAKLAAAKGVTPPAALTQLQQQQVDHLGTVHGRTFDHQYLNLQATMHQQALELYRNEADQGSDPDVKAFAARVLPRLEAHQAMVQKLGGRPMTT